MIDSDINSTETVNQDSINFIQRYADKNVTLFLSLLSSYGIRLGQH